MGLIQDIRYGIRMLRKYPMATFVAAITLALGIGANTAIFSALNAFMFRPLPVANADRLTVIGAHRHGTGDLAEFSYLDFNDLRASKSTAFSDVLGYDLSLAGLQVKATVEPTLLSFVSGNFFQALGLKPAAGRLIYGINTEQPATDPVVVLGYDYWKQRFNADPSVVGTQVKLNGHSATLIGVAPKGFHGLYSLVDTQIYVPIGTRSFLSLSDTKDFWTRRDTPGLRMLGVLKPGVTLAQAQQSIDVFASQITREYPEAHKGMTMRVFPERLARPEPDSSGSIVIVGVLFLALGGLVLLLACTNVANIVLVRATGREREMAVRAALGAAKRRLARQLLTESMVLAALGGLAGLAAGVWASSLLGSIRLQVASIPVQFDFSFDWRVFAFASSIALLTGILVGLAPVWRISRSDLHRTLHEGSRGVLAGTTRSRLRNTLVMAQVAGSLMLLVVAGLFVRSARNAEHAYLGFDPSHVLNVTMDPHSAGMNDQQAAQFVRKLEDRVRALPGVESVSYAATLPMGVSSRITPVYLPGQNSSAKEPAPQVLYNLVDAPYFATMRIPVLRGRGIVEQDTENTPLVAVISKNMARRFWPKQDAIGQVFSMKGPAGPFLQVVGIAQDGKYRSPTEDLQPFFYVSRIQNGTRFGTLQVRTAGDPDGLIQDVERQVHALAPDLPLLEVGSMEEALQGVNGFFLINMGTRLTGILGMIGLILAMVGVYGVVSYVAAQRTHEIGVRMALGADRGDILRMVLRQGVVLIGGGIILGLALAFVASRGLTSLMVGISARDPLTLASASILLALIGLAASLIPARRAMNVEPLRALKYE